MLHRLLNFGAACLLALTLAGCLGHMGELQPANKTYRLGALVYSPDFPDQAVVIVGLRQIGIPGQGSFGYAFSPVEGSNIDGRGEKSWSSRYGSGRDFGVHSETRVDYHIYKMPPGNYAATWILYQKRYMLVNSPRLYIVRATNYGQTYTQKIDLIEPKLTIETPIFSTKANEVVYIGDLVADFTDANRPTLSIASSADGARAALAEFGEKRPMVERRLLRVSGPGPRAMLATMNPQPQ